ncbi:ribonuclease Oy [Aricia agestis]|uniref:ribonuclease Oy n=1 Tax=Aricia agestis TaxID=91739 RepID=UPI001C20BF01|nr:ribonuclease Oy [Aricia agestis]
MCIYLIFKCINYVELSSVNANEFDLFIFTQLWPATDCMEWKKHNPHHTCNMPKNVDAWTVHGIWPTKLGTRGPEFCNRTWLFDPEQVRSIEDELEQSWANVYGGTPVYQLWAHEWSKHGTCAAQIQDLNSELKYFSTGLHWLQKYSMTDIFKAAQIIPSNTKKYSVNDINKVIKEKLNIDPSIVCKVEDSKNYLSEIRICFTKQLLPVNCDGIIARQTINGESILTNCKSEEVVYPNYNKWYVQLYKLVMWLQWFTF